MDTENQKKITIEEAITYAKAMVFQFKNSGREELTADYIENTMRDFSNWKQQDIIKLLARQLKTTKKKKVNKNTQQDK